MDSALQSALSARAPTTFTAFRIEVPGDPDDYVLKLLRAGQAEVEGEVFVGKDATFGTLSSIGPISDGVDTQASTANVVLMPPTEAAVAELANPLAQGAPCWIRMGAVDRETGATIATELLFQGELNYCVLQVSEDMRAVSMELITEEARQLEPNDERRLSHAFHQSVWPGENGLIHVTGVTQKDFWRVDKPSVGFGSGNAGGGNGGGGGFNDGPRSVIDAGTPLGSKFGRL